MTNNCSLIICRWEWSVTHYDIIKGYLWWARNQWMHTEGGEWEGSVFKRLVCAGSGGGFEDVGLGFLNRAGSTSSGFCEGESLCGGPIGAALWTLAHVFTHILECANRDTAIHGGKNIYNKHTCSSTHSHIQRLIERLHRQGCLGFRSSSMFIFCSHSFGLKILK